MNLAVIAPSAATILGAMLFLRKWRVQANPGSATSVAWSRAMARQPIQTRPTRWYDHAAAVVMVACPIAQWIAFKSDPTATKFLLPLGVASFLLLLKVALTSPPVDTQNVDVRWFAKRMAAFASIVAALWALPRSGEITLLIGVFGDMLAFVALGLAAAFLSRLKGRI